MFLSNSVTSQKHNISYTSKKDSQSSAELENNSSSGHSLYQAQLKV